MGHGDDALSAQEREENVAAQLEELEALEAIYAEGYEAIRGSAASSAPEVGSSFSDLVIASNV